MKRLFPFLFLALPTIGFAQTIDTNTGKVSFAEVVPVEKRTTTEMYSKARSWFVTSFPESKEALQLDSKEEAKLIGNGSTDITIGSSPGKMHFTLALEFKDGRYRYQFTNLTFKPQALNKYITAEEIFKAGTSEQIRQNYTNGIDRALTSLVHSLNSTLTDKGSDW